MARFGVFLIVREMSGGIRKHILQIVHELERKGYVWRLATDLGKGDAVFREWLRQNGNIDRCVGMKLHYYPTVGDFLICRSLKKEVGKFQRMIEGRVVIHGHGAKGGAYARLLNLSGRFSVVYTPHGGSLHAHHGFKGWLYRFIEKALSYFTTLFVFESSYSSSRFLRGVQSLPSSKYIVNPNGVEIPVELKSDYSLHCPIRIYAFGLLRFIKGFDILIQAGHLLIQSGYDLEIKIFGTGDYKGELDRLIQRLNLASRVELCEEVVGDQVPSLMREADIVVQPSRAESFGLVALEATSLGVPTAVSNVGGLVEIIRHKENGLVFESDSEEELASVVKQLIDDEALRRKLGVRGAERARSEFDIRRSLDRLMKAYEELGAS